MIHVFGRALLVLVYLFAFEVLAGAEKSASQNFQNALKSLQIAHAEASKFELRVNRQISKDGAERWTILADNSDTFVEVQAVGNMSEDASRTRLKNEVEIIKRLYETKRVPYADQISKTDLCAPEMRSLSVPVSLFSTNQKMIVGGANRNRAFGACNESDIAFFGALSGVYSSKSERFFKVTVYVKSDSGGRSAAMEKLEKFMRGFRFL